MIVIVSHACWQFSEAHMDLESGSLHSDNSAMVTICCAVVKMQGDSFRLRNMNGLE